MTRFISAFPYFLFSNCFMQLNILLFIRIFILFCYWSSFIAPSTSISKYYLAKNNILYMQKRFSVCVCHFEEKWNPWYGDFSIPMQLNLLNIKWGDQEFQMFSILYSKMALFGKVLHFDNINGSHRKGEKKNLTVSRWKCKSKVHLR